MGQYCPSDFVAEGNYLPQAFEVKDFLLVKISTDHQEPCVKNCKKNPSENVCGGFIGVSFLTNVSGDVQETLRTESVDYLTPLALLMFFTFRKRGCSFFYYSCFEFCKERNCKVTDIHGSYFSRSFPVLCFLAKSAIFLNIFVYGLCEMQITLFMACAKCSSLKF